MSIRGDGAGADFVKVLAALGLGVALAQRDAYFSWHRTHRFRA